MNEGRADQDPFLGLSEWERGVTAVLLLEEMTPEDLPLHAEAVERINGALARLTELPAAEAFLMCAAVLRDEDEDGVA